MTEFARMQVRPAQGYAGDLTPELAWQWVQEGRALLVDVRSDAEREWVGWVPGALGLAWKQWPGMALNPQFDAGVQQAQASGKPLLMLCRSGVRSIAAAQNERQLKMSSTAAPTWAARLCCEATTPASVAITVLRTVCESEKLSMCVLVSRGPWRAARCRHGWRTRPAPGFWRAR